LRVRRGDPERGLPLLEEAARGLPGQPEVRYHLGVALAETGDAARAATLLEEALAASGEFPWRGDAERRLAQLNATGQAIN
jgi:hypothetical protein